MTTRREFLARAPLGAAGLAAACANPMGQTGIADAAAAAPRAPDAPPRPILTKVPDGAPVLTWTPRHEDLVYTFGGAAPKQVIRSGTKIVTWTEDCFDGAVKSAADLPSKAMPPGHDNPQTGPFRIEGAAPGDTIVVHILKLEPARDYGVSSFSPGFGALVGTDQTAMVSADLQEMTWRYDLDAAKRTATAKANNSAQSWTVPLAPFLGCLGVAPAGGEVRTTIVPGPFGGNMDCWEVRAGNAIALGVNTEGALLSFGDGHYAMGQGEIMGAAIEGALHVELFVELQKKVVTPVPRIENLDEVMFVGSGRPLEDAARVAFKAMVGWVREHTRLSLMDAYQFVSQNSRAPIVQLVDPEYTVLVALDKSRLPRT